MTSIFNRARRKALRRPLARVDREPAAIRFYQSLQTRPSARKPPGALFASPWRKRDPCPIGRRKVHCSCLTTAFDWLDINAYSLSRPGGYGEHRHISTVRNTDAAGRIGQGGLAIRINNQLPIAVHRQNCRQKQPRRQRLISSTLWRAHIFITPAIPLGHFFVRRSAKASLRSATTISGIQAICSSTSMAHHPTTQARCGRATDRRSRPKAPDRHR